MIRSMLLATLCAAVIVGGSALAEDAPDEVRLRDGSVSTGRVVEVDKNTVILKSDAGVREFKRKDVKAIFFEAGGGAAPPGVTPGYTANGNLKVFRVTTLRRITDNLPGGDGKMEPSVAKISADGSKIFFYAPRTGLFSINPDGTGQTLVLANDAESRGVQDHLLEPSPDGKYVYWQNGQSGPLFRLKADGSEKKLLVREGAEYTPIFLRDGGRRIFFGARAFISSIDTEGAGDYKEFLSPAKITTLLKIPNDGSGKNFLTNFNASDDGTRIAFMALDLQLGRRQLYGINADGSGLKRLATTEFEPEYIQFAPDGQTIIFKHHETAWWTVKWDGSDLKKLPLCYVGHNAGPYHVYNRFSTDGKWFAYQASNDGGAGPIATTLDGREQFEPYFRLGFDGVEHCVTHWGGPVSYNASLTRFVYIKLYGQKQLIVGDINPPSAQGAPLLSEIEFSPVLSTNVQVPTHVGGIKARATAGTGKVARVVCLFNPLVRPRPAHPARWNFQAGWDAVYDGRYLNDEGKDGDKAAADSVFSNEKLKTHPTDYKPDPGRYSMRLMAQDDRHAVIVDVDGIEIKP